MPPRKRKQLISSDEAVPAKSQHKRPCSDCPWSRGALPGWLGGFTVDEWLAAAHGEEHIDCHTLKGAQCAGAAIYRANVCKSPRDPAALVCEPDAAKVFTTPAAFRDHHARRKRAR
jgi:hypothetical protein